MNTSYAKTHPPRPLNPLSPYLLTNPHTHDRYLVLGTLGETHHARIVYARDGAHHQPVAIKVMRKLAPDPSSGSRRNTRTVMALEHAVMREATETGRPFVAQMVAAWEDGVNVYLVMVSAGAVGGWV